MNLTTNTNLAIEETQRPRRPETESSSWTQDDRNALLRYARQRIGNMDAAEDVVQDTLTAAVASGTQFRGRSKRLTWAFGILKHKIADYQRASYRDRARRADVSTIVDESAEVHRGRGQLFGGIDEDNPASQCEYAEFWNVLKAGVDRLPPQTAEVFQRCFIRNDSSLEICQALDISRSNYWVMLHRARIHLRSYLAENWAAPSTLN